MAKLILKSPYIKSTGGASGYLKLKYGEKPEGLVVYRVAEDGTREKCETSYDSEEKLISWKTDSLALYIIAYEAP